MRKIRDAVGRDMEIMIEGHAFWSLPAAVQIARALEEFHPAWVEELPVDRPWRSFAGQYAPANRSFLEALARGRPPEPGLDVALVAHGLADAVYRSAREGGMPVRTRC